MLQDTTAPIEEVQDVRAIALDDMYNEGIRIHVFINELLLTPLTLAV